MPHKFTSDEDITVPTTTTTPASRAICRHVIIDLGKTVKAGIFKWDRGVSDGVEGGGFTGDKVDSVILVLDYDELKEVLAEETLDGESVGDAFDRVIAAKAVEEGVLPAGSHEDTLVPSSSSSSSSA